MVTALHNPRLSWKVTIIGDENSGKTSLVRRFVSQRFDQNYIPTLGINISVFSTKLLIVNQIIDVRFSIWDIAGQNSFRSLYKNYFAGTNGLIILFDLTRLSTFFHLENWIKIANENNIYSQNILLLGNKVDLSTKIEVTPEKIQHFQSQNHITHYIETSALNGHNIFNAFQCLAEKMYLMN